VHHEYGRLTLATAGLLFFFGPFVPEIKILIDWLIDYRKPVQGVRDQPRQGGSYRRLAGSAGW